MKTLIFITTIVLLASCGNNKLRFQRVPLFNKQKVVTVDDDQQALEQTKTANYDGEKSNPPSTTLEPENLEENGIDQTTQEHFSAQEPISITIDEEIIKETFPITQSDTVPSAESEENIAIALEAEKIASVGLWLALGVFAVLILSAVIALILFEWVPLLVGLIISFIFAVAAAILGVISKMKSHNTPAGSRKANVAIILGVLLSLSTGFILFLVAFL